MGLALIGMVGVAFSFGEFAAMRVGQLTALQTAGAPAPNVNLGDLLGAAH